MAMHGLNASLSLSEARCGLARERDREREGASEIRTEERKRKERMKEGKRVGTRRDMDAHEYKLRAPRGLPNVEKEESEREGGKADFRRRGLREGCGSGGRSGRREDAAGV